MPGSDTLAPAPASRFVLPRKHRGVLDDDQRERALGFARELLSVPTAPYFEDGELGVIERFVREREGLELRRDEHHNLIVAWNGVRKPRAKQRTLAFSAHLDHPGFRYEGKRAGKHRATFLGGVPARYMAGAAVRFFAPGGTQALATARVERVVQESDAGLACELEAFEGRAAREMFGVFDLPDGVLRGTRLHARVCDDLMGAAAILALLDELVRTGSEQPCLGIFTRAEETGFVGCLGLVQSRALPADLDVVGLECSPRRAAAKVGHGPVIRVGDRRSVFDPYLTHHLQRAAESLSARVAAFVAQRALMDGGSCESTAYNAFGVRAGAACLALGNYHNCGPNGAVAAEYVDWNDFEGLVALLLEAARSYEGGGPVDGFRPKLVRLFERERAALASSAQRIGERGRREER